jgi:hypothetical protein
VLNRETSPAMTDVFISYKREERARVERLAQALADLGLDVWFDVRLTAGIPWSPEIEAHARKAFAIVVCWSEAASRSPWVLREAQIGMDENKLAPLFFEGCILPPPFGAFHTLDFRAWNGDFTAPDFVALVARLAELGKRSALPESAQAIARGREADLVNRTREMLVDLATRHVTVTYGEAQERLGVDLDTLVAALDAVTEVNRIQRQPPLCALVVTKRAGLPGRGFFQKHCFLESEKDPQAEAVFERLVERVFEYDWR